MPYPGGNIVRKPYLTVLLVGVDAATREGAPDTPVDVGGLGMANLILEAAAPAVSARVSITGNDATALIIDDITSTSLRLYGAAAVDSTLYVIKDISGSEIDIAVGDDTCVYLGGILKGFNYIAALPDLTEASQRTITVLTTPR